MRQKDTEKQAGEKKRKRRERQSKKEREMGPLKVRHKIERGRILCLSQAQWKSRKIQQ